MSPRRKSSETDTSSNSGEETSTGQDEESSESSESAGNPALEDQQEQEETRQEKVDGQPAADSGAGDPNATGATPPTTDVDVNVNTGGNAAGERGPLSPAQYDDDGWGDTPAQMRPNA